MRSSGSSGPVAAWPLVLPCRPPTPNDVAAVSIVRVRYDRHYVVVLPTTVPVVAVSQRGSLSGSRGVEAGTCAL